MQEQLRLISIGEVDCDIFYDSGVWNIPLSDSIRIEIVSRGPVDLQNKEGPFLLIEKPGSMGINSISYQRMVLPNPGKW